MILVAGGDSFTYGSELQDGVSEHDPNGTEPAYAVVSKSTYSALLAKELGMDYYCAAYPGFANGAIRRTTMNACEAHKENIGLVLVNWSFPSRFEFHFAYDTEERWGNWYSVSPWSVLDDTNDIQQSFQKQNNIILQHHINHLARARRTGTADFAKNFYKHVGSSAYYETFSSLSEVVLLQHYLTTNNIPYIFSMVDECLLNNYDHWKDESLAVLYNQIDFSRWIYFPENRGFYSWAKDSKFPFGTTHPLEEAHLSAFKHIKGNYNELVKKYYQ